MFGKKVFTIILYVAVRTFWKFGIILRETLQNGRKICKDKGTMICIFQSEMI